jgi:hypothetical protein
MAVLAYDYIAVVQRIECGTQEPKEGEEKVGEAKRQPYTQELPDRVSRMAGLWRINPDFERLMGAPDREKPQDYPQSLRLSFAVPGAPMLRKEAIALIEDMFVARMRHTIIAVGEWKTEADSNFAADRDSKCFVTTSNGATYLWLGTPDKSLFGAEVHFVWLDTMRRSLILDGNSMLPPRLRKSDNVVAYSPADLVEDGERPSKKDDGGLRDTDAVEAAKSHVRALLTGDMKTLCNSYAAQVQLLTGHRLLLERGDALWTGMQMDREKLVAAATENLKREISDEDLERLLRELTFKSVSITEGEFVTKRSPFILSKDGTLRFEVVKGDVLLKITPKGESSPMYLQLRNDKEKWMVVAEYLN